MFNYLPPTRDVGEWSEPQGMIYKWFPASLSLSWATRRFYSKAPSELSESVLKVEFDTWDHWFVKVWRLKKIAKNLKFYIDAKIIQNQFLYQKSMILEEKLMFFK